MFEVYECADCKWALLLGDATIICKNKKLSPGAVDEFEPVGNGNAEDCPEFFDGEPEQLPDSSLKEVENYSAAHQEIKSWYEVCYAWYLLQNGN